MGTCQDRVEIAREIEKIAERLGRFGMTFGYRDADTDDFVAAPNLTTDDIDHAVYELGDEVSKALAEQLYHVGALREELRVKEQRRERKSKKKKKKSKK